MMSLPNPPMYMKDVAFPLKFLLFLNFSNKNQIPTDIKHMCEIL